MAENCVFCSSRAEGGQTIFETEHFLLIYDNFPVSKGHALIVSKRHVLSMFELNSWEWCNLSAMVLSAKAYLDKIFHPDGYNVGINCGEAAGQTVFHLHIHVIPRYKGDVTDPRGGIRNLKKSLVPYLVRES